MLIEEDVKKNLRKFETVFYPIDEDVEKHAVEYGESLKNSTYKSNNSRIAPVAIFLAGKDYGYPLTRGVIEKVFGFFIKIEFLESARGTLRKNGFSIPDYYEPEHYISTILKVLTEKGKIPKDYVEKMEEMAKRKIQEMKKTKPTTMAITAVYRTAHEKGISISKQDMQKIFSITPTISKEESELYSS